MGYHVDNYSQEQLAKPVPCNSNGDSFGKKSMFDLVGGFNQPRWKLWVSWDHEIPN